MTNFRPMSPDPRAQAIPEQFELPLELRRLRGNLKNADRFVGLNLETPLIARNDDQLVLAIAREPVQRDRLQLAGCQRVAGHGSATLQAGTKEF